MRRLAGLLILLVFLCHSEVSHADTWVTDPTSVAWRNTEEVQNFLNEIGETELAAYLGTALSRKSIYYTPTLTDWWGTAARGLTNGITFTIGFSDDTLPVHQLVSFTTSQTDDELSKAALYFAIATHELIHYRDMQMPNRVSPELDTYERSFHIYFKALHYFMGKFKEYDEAGNPMAEHWRRKARVMADLIHMEMTVYEEDEYGVISNAYFPFDLHDGCVRNLDVPEAARYALLLAGQLRRGNSYAETVADFDKQARYDFSASGGNCLTVAPAVPVAESNMAAGAAGPYRRQKIIELEHLPMNHMLRITKRGSKKNTVDIQVFLITDIDARPISTKEVGRLDSLQDMTVIGFPMGSGRVLVAVSEDLEGTFPQQASELELIFTHIWYDEHNTRREAPIINHTELSTAQQAAYGYYPVAVKSAQVTFAINTYIDPEYHERQVAGFVFHAYRGLQLRVKLPEFDGRMFALYRKGEVDPKTGLVKLIRIPSYYAEATGYRVDVDGDYVYLVSRMVSAGVLRGAEARLELSLSKAMATNPASIEVHALTTAELASFGAHRPSRKTLMFRMHTSELPSGFSPREFGSDMDPLKPFQLADLDVKQGDWLRIHVHALRPNVRWATIVEQVGNRFETRAYSHDDNMLEVQVRSDNPHFLLLEGETRTSFLMRGRVELELRRTDLVGPRGANPHFLTSAEILSRYGYRPLVVKRFADARLTGAHPRSFSLKDSFFQLYGFEVANVGRVRVFKPELGINRRLFLCRVNKEAWDAGRPALEGKIFMIDRDYFERTLALEPGRYIVAVETGWQAEPGETPFELTFGFGKNAVQDIPFHTLTVGEMNDPRNRLLN